MSGDRPPIHIEAGAGSVLARAIEALSRFPTDQPWALIGGVAVFIRLGSVTRPTADADTVARSQAELIERLVADEPATVVSGGELEVPVGDGTIEVDVMDLADDPLPGDPERRAFALARRYALDAAVTERVVVSDGEAVVVDAQIPVASTAALAALKTVSMVRRPHGNSPHKIGSTSTTSSGLSPAPARAPSPPSSSPTALLRRGLASRSTGPSAPTSTTRCSASAPTTARPEPRRSATPRSKRPASSPTNSPSSSRVRSPGEAPWSRRGYKRPSTRLNGTARDERAPKNSPCSGLLDDTSAYPTSPEAQEFKSPLAHHAVGDLPRRSRRERR